MHISEGILSGEPLVIGAALAAIGTAIGLRSLDYDKIPQAGVLSASFFVATLVHVPLTVTSVHLILNGLIGIILGWGAFPVILIALTLQAVFFQFGGLTTLGVNTIIMALPAVICYLIFKSIIQKNTKIAIVAAFICGFFSVFLATLLMAFALMHAGEAFLEIAYVVILAHLPVMIIEGVITAFCIGFLKKVQPLLLYHGLNSKN